MSNKVKTRGANKTGSKIPEGIDLTPLDFLQKGDVPRVAKDLGESYQYVSRVKNLHHYNVRILAALLKKGMENRNALTQGKKQ